MPQLPTELTGKWPKVFNITDLLNIETVWENSTLFIIIHNEEIRSK